MPLSPPHLPARASSQGVLVELEHLAQLPALAKQLVHPGHLSPGLLRLLPLPSPQRDELPRVLGASYQHGRLGRFCVVQRPLAKGIPPLDKLFLASCPNQPFARAVGLSCLLHLLSSFPTRFS